MRSLALIVGLSTFAVGSHCSAMSNPNEIVIAKGVIVNVDEKNSSFDVRDASGRQSSHRMHQPIVMTIRCDNSLPYQGTWDDLRKISASGRITSVAVDPSDPNVIYFHWTTWWA